MGTLGSLESQTTLLLFDACLNIWCPTNPMYPFYLQNFLLALVCTFLVRSYASTHEKFIHSGAK